MGWIPMEGHYLMSISAIKHEFHWGHHNVLPMMSYCRHKQTSRVQIVHREQHVDFCWAYRRVVIRTFTFFCVDELRRNNSMVVVAQAKTAQTHTRSHRACTWTQSYNNKSKQIYLTHKQWPFSVVSIMSYNLSSTLSKDWWLCLFASLRLQGTHHTN